MLNVDHRDDAAHVYAAAAAAHILNIYIPADDSPAIKFQKIKSIIADAIQCARIEAMANAVKPTEN